MEINELDDFFQRQLSAWDACRERYSLLNEANHKFVEVEGRKYDLSYNPGRMKSATAKVNNGVVERPCFLCRDNRPAEQTDIVIKPNDSKFTYLLSVNPFPILTHHFTIISSVHCRQTITPQRLRDMAYMARELPEYLVFFNGACSGASAPDHFHFQAVPRHLVPLTEWNDSVMTQVGVQQCEAESVKIDFDKSDFCNILCWNSPQGIRWWVVNRTKHRPWQYDAEGDEKVLISPASLEFAGVVPLAREEDYQKMTSHLLADIFQQCSNSEPLLDVGLSEKQGDVVQNADGRFTLNNVRIGIGFHWDRLKSLTYEGKAVSRREPDTNKEWIINRIPIEKYLASVISSEMSATSSLALLKAHAVISRSWVMKQLERKLSISPDVVKSSVAESSETEEQIIRWYDSHAHTFFDVCADDHCQRYQGISSKLNPIVLKAVEETRGEVLMSDGKICDARFSKCCGGITEEYKYCWENISPTYLQSVHDTRSDGSVFCNTHDETILKQVLTDYDQETHDFFTWKKTYTQMQLTELLERKLGLSIGKVLALEPVEIGCSGRISKLKIQGTLRTIIIGKELEIRKALSETHLYSSAFTISTSKNIDDETIFTLNGKGWGHGVGLCQIGAAVMGAEGYDYRQILSHYYKNSEIKKIW